MEIEKKYMQRCIQLAYWGLGSVSPNPMVGAVIVCDGKIIGEGYHRQWGGPHAEVYAVGSVKEPELLKRSTLYVSLEPCSHYGKTPPCAALILEKQIPRVVIGMQDPFPQVSGNGIRMLRDAGVEVYCGLMKEECEELNKRFLTYFCKNRPYVFLKWAQSEDGFLDAKREYGDDRTAVRLSGPFSLMRNHKKRSEEDAILVGTRTALLDNPSLNVRYWKGRNPVRVVIDRKKIIPEGFHLSDGTQETWVLPEDHPDAGTWPVSRILDFLYERKVHSVIVEGGAQLLGSFLREGVWDEAWVETVPLLLGSGVVAPETEGSLVKTELRGRAVLSVYNNIVIH